MESKSNGKRQLILHTATQIVLNNGFNSLTLDAVAKHAGISKGGLLYHFPNKESLIKELAQFIFEEFCFIRLVLDGLYYAQLLHVAPLEKERQNEVLQQLIRMTKEGS